MKTDLFSDERTKARGSRPARWPVGRTDHAAAVAYASKGWGGYKSRDDWEESLRYKGTFKL